ncbi:unnamed protein product [Rotaria sp. Silwood2]|nr:unnamed protein product [Rotaria sp. Silwood2]
MDFYLPLINITKDNNIPSQQDMIRRFSDYFQYFKLWLKVGYPSSLAGLAMPSGNPAVQCIGNYSANFTLQDMGFKALFQVLDDNRGISNGTIIFWWDNPSSMDYYKEKDSNNWECSWTVRGKPAECTIAEAFHGICSTNRIMDMSFIYLSMMVKELRIEALSIGLELLKLSKSEYTSYWRTLIENIRREGYSGLLTYSSVFDPLETQQIGVWNELDFIGRNFSLPLLNSMNDSMIPFPKGMVKTFSDYFQYFKLWLKYPSSLLGLAIPLGDSPPQCIENYSANLTLQNVAFEALFQAMNQVNETFKGIIVFRWDNPSSGDSYNERDSNNWACS